MEQANRKLTLNKQTFSILSEKQMSELEGGTDLAFWLNLLMGLTFGLGAQHIIDNWDYYWGNFRENLEAYTEGCPPWSIKWECTPQN